jgi:RNA polymerase sigma-70 factor, ECF subfamily
VDPDEVVSGSSAPGGPRAGPAGVARTGTAANGAPASANPEVAAAVADAHRREWAFVLAATVRVTRDLDLAEECVQDAYAQALATWAARGIPASPGAWLTTVARRRGMDLLRRAATLRRSLPLLLDDQVDPGPDENAAVDIPDDRLRLIFTCCHPAIAADTQVALTLRLLCGLTTAEVARAFLVSEPTMAARITRAKKKIAAARIPYRVPPAQELPARIDAVLTVVHLLFTTGHTAPVGADLVRRDLVERSLDLARMLRALLPADANVAGLLALILLTDARRDTRVAPDGRLLLLAEQDRVQWDRAAIREGIALVREALRRRPPGRFALMAAIAAVHAEAPTWQDTDWREVVGLYDLLVQIWPSPVVALNRAVAVGLADGPEAGLTALDDLAAEPQLAGYSYLAAARADFLRRLGRTGEARLCYEEALLLTENAVERDFLAGRVRQLDD